MVEKKPEGEYIDLPPEGLDKMSIINLIDPQAENPVLNKILES